MIKGGKCDDALMVVNNLAGTLAVPTHPITINTNPASRSFNGDGAIYKNSQTFSWEEESEHTVNIATSPQIGEQALNVKPLKK